MVNSHLLWVLCDTGSAVCCPHAESVSFLTGWVPPVLPNCGDAASPPVLLHPPRLCASVCGRTVPWCPALSVPPRGSCLLCWTVGPSSCTSSSRRACLPALSALGRHLVTRANPLSPHTSKGLVLLLRGSAHPFWGSGNVYPPPSDSAPSVLVSPWSLQPGCLQEASPPRSRQGQAGAGSLRDGAHQAASEWPQLSTDQGSQP